MGIIDMKTCRECGRVFDIGTNFDICPDCRYKKNKERWEKNINQKKLLK